MGFEPQMVRGEGAQFVLFRDFQGGYFGSGNGELGLWKLWEWKWGAGCVMETLAVRMDTVGVWK